MSFGLTKQGNAPAGPAPEKQTVAIFTPPENQLAMPRVEGPGRIQRHQLICRKCHKPVEKTEQFKEHSGRTVINCAYECHGERGVIRVCEDQWGWDTRMLVLQGLPELCDKSGQPKMLTDTKPEPVQENPASKPDIIDIEATTDFDITNLKRLN